MNTLFRHLLVLASAAFVAACGGGGNEPLGGGNNPDPGTSTVPASIELVASSTQVSSGGGQVDLTAFVKNSANAIIANAAVTFQTDTGTLGSITAATDDNGIATAKFSAGADKSNRAATITVTAGSVSRAVQVNVVDTTLAISGVTTLTIGETRTFNVTAADSAGAPIANQVLSVTSSLANGLSAPQVTTDSAGQASVSYTATNAGADTLSFTGAGATASSSLTISGEDFKFASPAAGTQIPVDTPSVLTVRYFKNGAPRAGVTVNFAATAGTLSTASATTGPSGTATVTIRSTSAVAATVQASLVDGTTTASATLALQFIATTPSSLVLQVNPASIGPNAAGSSTQQAQVVARVTDLNGNPVANRTVNFSRVSDPSGGNLSQPSAVTDLNGEAAVQYVAGPQSSADNGVKLRAIVAGTSPSVVGNASVTVNQSALFIGLGTGNVITNIDPQTYKKDWVVYVTDANGVVVPDITLTIRALPVSYLKGTLSYNGTVWAYAPGVVQCANEDSNYNGILDANEDDEVSGTPTAPVDNGDGVLWPGNVISVTPGTVKTNASGRATLSLIYAESYAPWVRIKLTVTAVVSGTESSTATTFIVPGEAGDFSNEATPPAGVVSPFGTASACTDPN